MTWTTLVEAFHQLWCDPARADLPALIDDADGSTYTYRGLHTAVGAYARWLRENGVQKGDRVAIRMERSSRLVISILGTIASGACPCPLEPKLGEEEVLRRSQVAGLKWAVSDSLHQDEVRYCGLPNDRYLTITGIVERKPDWVNNLSPLDDGFLLFTSGSSGKPKGVLQNHKGMLTNALGIVAHTSLVANDRLLHVMPLYHTNGVNNQLFAPLLAGGCVVLASRFKAESMPELIERYQPTLLTGVPTMYSRMLPLKFSRESLASLRMLRCGSAPITEELHRRIEDKFSLPLVISYGLSEATCTSTMNPPDRRKLGSIGTVLQGQRIFLRTPDGDIIDEVGTEGEICVTGPSLMTGYLLEGANGVATPVGDVLRTGDLGRFDNDGYLFITGRLKDVIIRGGENLSPNLIEEVIASVTGVLACCIVGRPHADLGEVPVAVVVREQSANGDRLSPDIITAAIRKKLSRIHQPAEYLFVNALPENATGKVDRNRLREMVQMEGTR